MTTFLQCYMGRNSCVRIIVHDQLAKIEMVEIIFKNFNAEIDVN